MSVMVSANGALNVGTVANWAGYFGLTHPVLVDNGDVYRYATQFPTYVVIDRDMTIQEDNMWPWRDSTITNLF